MSAPAVDRPPLAPVAEPRISIIVVHYNTESLTRACLASLPREARDMPIEVFLVDNGSSDGSGLRLAAEHPWVHFLRLERGIGFGAANNLAATRSRGRLLLFLNSDTEAQNDCLRRVADFIEGNPRVALAGCRLVKGDGSLDSACRRSFPTPGVSLWKLLGLNARFPNNRVFAAYDLRYMPRDLRYQVDSLVGAFLMARRESLPAGPFDEDYFFYGEDIDLCYTVKERGWEVWYLGDIFMLHHKGGTTNKRAPWVIFHFHDSMRIFYNKHYRRRYSRLVTCLVFAGIYLRMAVMLVLNLFKPRLPA
jgi:GT2 family glycosyltransferase